MSLFTLEREKELLRTIAQLNLKVRLTANNDYYNIEYMFISPPNYFVKKIQLQEIKLQYVPL